MMKSTKKCPLFSTISLAADGDEVAIEKILNHYDALFRLLKKENEA